MATWAAEQTVRLNAVTEVNGGNFLLGKVDPHIVFSFAQPIETTAMGVSFVIRLAPASPTSTSEPVRALGQLFWATKTHGFEEDFSLKFPLDLGTNEFFIPMGLLDKDVTRVRIDVDGCECLMEVDGPHWREDSELRKAFYPASVAEYVGLKSGRDIPLEGWVGVQFDPIAPGVFEFAGWDPRIVNTEDLNLPLDIAAGIYFEFIYDLPFKFQKYELFWKLDNSKWSQLRSAHFILPADQTARGNYRVFIPFKDLYSRQILQRLRLDFEACEKCRLEIKQTRLVGYEEVEKYRSLEPERLYYVHTEKPPTDVLRRAISGKLFKDLPFLISWAFLLLLVIGTGITLLTKSRNISS